ncbi:hypothetical protein Hanom_Chr15g01388431 [Helianthus anomalus]
MTAAPPPSALDVDTVDQVVVVFFDFFQTSSVVARVRMSFSGPVSGRSTTGSVQSRLTFRSGRFGPVKHGQQQFRFGQQ